MRKLKLGITWILVSQLAPLLACRLPLDAWLGTQESQVYEAQIGGTSVFLIDTPGFDDSKRSDGDIILEISKSLSTQVAIGVKLLGVIYLHDITNSRMRGSLKRELEIVKLIIGSHNYKHLLLVTTKWGDGTRKREFEKRQQELEDIYWEDLINGGAGVFRFEGTAESGRSIVSQLNDGVDVLLALQAQLVQRPGVHLRDTDVGKYAMQVRKEKKQELQRLSQTPGRRQKDVDELQSRLDVGGLDLQKLDVKILDQVKAYISDVTREELNKNSRKPSPLNIITWTLSAIGTILGALGGTGVL
jgi:hypothetical protein